MSEIIPGILEAEWDEIEKKLELIKPFTNTVHIDIIDGKFTDNLTLLDPSPFQKYSKDFFFELHMMVKEPVNYLESWANAGFKRFIGHIEKMSDINAFITGGRRYGEIGLAIDGPTDIGILDGINLNDLDCLLVMTIKAGASGQKFQPELLEKVRVLRGKTAIPIEVDGGINDMTVINAKESGATRFVANSFLFKANAQEQYEKLESLLEE